MREIKNTSAIDNQHPQSIRITSSLKKMFLGTHFGGKDRIPDPQCSDRDTGFGLGLQRRGDGEGVKKGRG